MISPPSLKPGNKVGIIAPARKVSFKELAPAIKVFNSWGLETILSPHLLGSCNQYSGPDEERAADLQAMLDHPEIRAVFCARGGYGTLRIIDQLNFSKFCKKPKWIVGFSDITVLHAHIQQNFGIETLHAMMPLNIVSGKKMQKRMLALESLHSALIGQKLKYKTEPHLLNRKGSAEGILIGGNLSLLYSLNGSISDPDTRDKILFIEDLDEYLYHIDRIMMNLKRAGKLNHIRGLVVGGMTEMKDNKIPFGKTAEEIISEAVKDYDFPVCFNFPAGHIDDNRALILGRNVKLKVNKKECVLEFD
jgi:muramoyltetrapeptide carboxypeptidase